MSGNAHDPRTLEERLQWIADWSEPEMDLADAGTAHEALDRIRSQAIRIRQLEDEYTRRVHADNVEMDALRAQLTAAREQAEKMAEALGEAEKHFGPFSEITINGQHDPDDVRVVAMIRQALAEWKAT